MNLACNIPLRQKSEQDRMRELWLAVERDRKARVVRLRYERAVKVLKGAAKITA